MENTGNGAKAPVPTGNRPTAANSTGSTPKGRKPTSKTKSVLTPEMALQILQQSVLNCQHSGIDIAWYTYYPEGHYPGFPEGVKLPCIGIQIRVAQIVDGNFAMVASTKENAKVEDHPKDPVVGADTGSTGRPV